MKLADFGMVSARDRIAERTAPGFVKGTLSYMAPEILTGKPASPRSDLFSLACTMWEALAGVRLFHAATDADVVARIRKCEVPLLGDRRPDIPLRLGEAIHKALAADPASRFNSAREMAHELNEIMREDDSWGDADMIVSTAVAEARIAQKRTASRRE